MFVAQAEKVDPITQPHIHDLKFVDGEPLTFTLHVEVRPQLELGRVNGFEVARPSGEVTDEMVEEQLDQLREQKAQWSPTDDRPMSGDMVTVVLATAEEGADFPEGQEYRIVLGAGQAIEGVEEAIMETAPGTTNERAVKWPEDFPDESQRGKTKRVRVELKDVKRKALPELDDAFAREVGDFDSADALRAAIRTDLATSAEREAESSVRQQLIDQIRLVAHIGAHRNSGPSALTGNLGGVRVEAIRTYTQVHFPLRIKGNSVKCVETVSGDFTINLGAIA